MWQRQIKTLDVVQRSKLVAVRLIQAGSEGVAC
jgi:hypothetical protein